MANDARDVATTSDNVAAAGTVASSDKGGWPAAILIAATFFIATAPTLTWLEFSSGIENLTVATALEIRRTNQWLLPSLEGEPRIAKPPLAAWIAAAAISPTTFREIDSPDPVVRSKAYRALAWQIRWPALACACATLLAIFHLGRTIGGVWAGLLAMTVAGSSLYFLRFGKQATTDVQLAMWSAIAMAALAHMCLVRTSWSASLIAGAAMGMALMSKGPVALLLTALPAAIFLVLQRRRAKIAPIVAAIIVMLLVGGAWYAFVAMRIPGVWERWRIELLRSDPAESPDNPLSYVSLFSNMLPWSIVFVHGLIWTALTWRERNGWTLALLFVIVPVVVMSFFPDRKERYLLPLLAPASIVTARGLSAMLDPTDPRRIPPWVQWTTIFVIGIGLPLIGMTDRIGGSPWYSTTFAAASIAFIAIVICVFSLMSRALPLAIVGATAIVMLIVQPIFFLGYRNTREGRSEMRPLAEMIRRDFPDAQTYYCRPRGARRVPGDLSIYLNRASPWIADPDALEASTKPQMYIIIQPDDTDDTPAAGWTFFAKVKRDEDWYAAFVR